MIRAIVDDLAPELIAQIDRPPLRTDGDNVERLRSEARFAALCLGSRSKSKIVT